MVYVIKFWLPFNYMEGQSIHWALYNTIQNNNGLWISTSWGWFGFNFCAFIYIQICECLYFNIIHSIPINILIFSQLLIYSILIFVIWSEIFVNLSWLFVDFGDLFMCENLFNSDLWRFFWFCFKDILEAKKV